MLSQILGNFLKQIKTLKYMKKTSSIPEKNNIIIQAQVL